MHIIEETRIKLLQDLKIWIQSNLLKVNVLSEDVYEIEGVGKFLLVNPKSLTPNEDDKNEIILQDFKLFLDEFEQSVVDEVDYYLFQFGTQFFYTKDPLDPKFTFFKYLGSANLQLQEDYPYLGIHGGYELSHGSRSYKDWAKKAKFLGIKTLGICEENTLSGTLAFQNYCEKEGIKPIIGETIIIKEGIEIYRVKLYPKNQVGFENLLRISNQVNSVPEKYVEFSEFVKNSSEIVCVISGEVTLNEGRINLYKKFFEEDVYYQLDYTEWSSDERDIRYLENLKLYFSNFIDKIKPVLLVDSYYLDKEDAIVRKYLNKMGSVGFKPQSDKQYFKSVDEIYTESFVLFEEEDERQITLIEEGIKNAKEIVSKISYKYQATYLHLPAYEMSPQEIDKFGTSEGLFFHLIEKGFNRKVKGKVENEDIYWDRLEIEIDVLQRGGFVDYFLILWDVYNFCEENNIWVGLGRGSSAGSAVAWLLGITGVDPIRYNLLFERFLNEGRLFKDIKVEKIIVNSGEGEVELDMLERIIINRNGKEMEISASDLKEGDDLINAKMRDLFKVEE